MRRKRGGQPRPVRRLAGIVRGARNHRCDQAEGRPGTVARTARACAAKTARRGASTKRRRGSGAVGTSRPATAARVSKLLTERVARRPTEAARRPRRRTTPTQCANAAAARAGKTHEKTTTPARAGAAAADPRLDTLELLVGSRDGDEPAPTGRRTLFRLPAASVDPRLLAALGVAAVVVLAAGLIGVALLHGRSPSAGPVGNVTDISSTPTGTASATAQISAPSLAPSRRQSTPGGKVPPVTCGACALPFEVGQLTTEAGVPGVSEPGLAGTSSSGPLLGFNASGAKAPTSGTSSSRPSTSTGTTTSTRPATAPPPATTKTSTPTTSTTTPTTATTTAPQTTTPTTPY